MRMKRVSVLILLLLIWIPLGLSMVAPATCEPEPSLLTVEFYLEGIRKTPENYITYESLWNVTATVYSDNGHYFEKKTPFTNYAIRKLHNHHRMAGQHH